MSNYEWLRYANQGATRNLPLSDQLLEDLAFLDEMGLLAEVFSGGQPTAGNGPRVGSTRHDLGHAADIFLYDRETGRRLDWSNENDIPTYQEFVRQARRAGLTGFGAGPGYMQQGSMHVGYGNPGVWGAEGRGANAPQWLIEAFNGVTGPDGTPIMSADPGRGGNGVPSQAGLAPGGGGGAGLADPDRSPYSTMTALFGRPNEERGAYQQGLDAHGQGAFARGDDGSMNVFGRTLDDAQRRQFSRGLLQVGAGLMGM